MQNRNRIFSILRDSIIVILITLLLAEAALRILGYKAYYFPPFSIVATPQTTLVPHANYGLALRPDGLFNVTMNQQHHYQATHLPDSTRFAGAGYAAFPELHFHGCSFTYGMGENDEQTFPYLVQQSLPQNRIRNMAVPGHGTIQSLLRLREQLKKDTLPSHVFLGYAAFHDERNVLSINYREHLYYGFRRMSPAVHQEFLGGKNALFPYGKIKDEQLHIQWVSMRDMFRAVPLREYSAFANLCQNVLNRQTEKALHAEEVTQAVVLEMKQLCEAKSIAFTVLSVTEDAATETALQRFEQLGVNVLRMGVNTQLPRYNHAPHDSHPNAVAHRIYADSLLQYLNNDDFKNNPK